MGAKDLDGPAAGPRLDLTRLPVAAFLSSAATAAVVYIVAGRVRVSAPLSVFTVPALYATTVITTLALAALLAHYGAATGERRFRWLSAACATACGAAVLEASTAIRMLVDGSPGVATDRIVGLGLLLHGAPGIVALFASGRRASPSWRRVGYAAAALAALLAVTYSPGHLGVGFTEAHIGLTGWYRGLAATIAGLSTLGAVRWRRRFGGRPSTPDGWILILLALAAAGALVSAAAATMTSTMWFAAVIIRSLQFLVPTTAFVAVLPSLLAAARRAAWAEDAFPFDARLLSSIRAEQSSGATRMIEQLEDVVRRDGVHMVFQPILELRSGTLVGVEALARFDVDLSPGDVFDHAPDWLRLELEILCLRKALAAFGRQSADVYVAVNLSPDALADARLHDLLAAADHRVVLEITEHAAIDDYESLVQRLAPLRRLGALLAVDDAGAGFASLRHIIRLAPDVIKLDMSLTREVHKQGLQRSLTAALARFAHEHHRVLIAEGIETEEELTVLRELDITCGQGYLLGRPGPLPAEGPHYLISSSFSRTA